MHTLYYTLRSQIFQFFDSLGRAHTGVHMVEGLVLTAPTHWEVWGEGL